MNPAMPLRRTISRVNANKNVNWLSSPGAWAWYIGSLTVGWLIISAFVEDIGLSWTYLHLTHGIISYYFLHWMKGSPVVEDQGKYDSLTFWEQIDNGVYSTSNRKFLTVIPVALFCIATHATDFSKQPLGLNLAVVLVLLIAKLPSMHKVRIFGINKW